MNVKYCCKQLDCYVVLVKVDFQLQSEEGDTGTFIANGEWALLGRYKLRVT